jgi:protein O-mannosyl-transferase
MSRPAVPIRVAYAALAAAALALLVYAGSLGNGFAYDDAAVIAGDSRILELDVGGILTGGYWQDDDLGLYRPLTSLTFALDWVVAPRDPAWFHLVNVVLHALASALVVLLLARLWTPAGALFGGLLFAVHPVHVEAVANVVGRAELLTAIFFLLACLVWVDRASWSSGRGDAARAYASAGSTIVVPADPKERGFSGASTLLRWVATPILFTLALFSKEAAIVLPAVLPLLDIATGRLRRTGVRRYVAWNARAYALLAAVAAAYLVVRAAVLDGAVAPERLDPSLEVLVQPGARIMTALTAWPQYARLLFAPVTLLADYGPGILGPATTIESDVALGGAIVVAAIGGGALALLRGWHRTGLALLWFPVTILPVSNLLIPIGVLVAERTLYLPSIALCFGAAALVDRVQNLAPRVRRAAAAAAVIAIGLLGARTLVRTPEWESSERIMLALVRDRPDSFRGQWHLARIARLRGDEQAAIDRYARALALWPYRQRLVFEAIGFASRTGHLDYASELSTFAVRRWPGDADAHRFLAAITLDRGDTTAAREYLRAGLEVDPADSTMLRMRAAIESR